MKKRFMTLLLSLMMILTCFVPSDVNAATIIPSDVSVAKTDCVLASLPGKFLATQTKALARINEIRKEACDKGYINPETGNKLKSSDYKPIKWSEDMEYIARIRAAEASITIAHYRTNKQSCLHLQSPNGISSDAEVLAWHNGSDMLTGIDLWYSEKNDWINQDSSKETGHYESMINPANTYVGIATWLCEDTDFYNTTAGEFLKSDASLSTTMKPAVSGNQILEVHNDYIKSCSLIASETSAGYSCYMKVSLKGAFGATITCNAYQPTYTVSDPSIGTITSSGKYTQNKCGSVTITGKLNSKFSKTKTVSKHFGELTSKVTKTATCSSTGIRTYHCSACDSTARTETIAKKAHKLDIYNRCTVCGGLKDGVSASVPNVKIRSVSRGKTYLTVKWNKNTKVKGYQIRYSRNANMSGSKTVKITSNKTVSKKINSLKRKTKYYMQIRTYKTINGKTYYSVWSARKAVTTK